MIAPKGPLITSPIPPSARRLLSAMAPALLAYGSGGLALVALAWLLPPLPGLVFMGLASALAGARFHASYQRTALYVLLQEIDRKRMEAAHA